MLPLLPVFGFPQRHSQIPPSYGADFRYSPYQREHLSFF